MKKLFKRKIKYLKSLGYKGISLTGGSISSFYTFKNGRKEIEIDQEIMSNNKYFKTFKKIINRLIKKNEKK